jgi:hypothetical protein
MSDVDQTWDSVDRFNERYSALVELQSKADAKRIQRSIDMRFTRFEGIRAARSYYVGFSFGAVSSKKLAPKNISSE